ncbi:hypothetical protein DYST_04675 [Dyella terrae]|nr:hypothetical protein DYST_04675 [Dyella terrae]
MSFALFSLVLSAQAEVVPGKARYLSAADKLLSLMQGKGQSEMPRQSDPTVAPLFAVLSDVKGTFGEEPVEAKDMGDLFDVCGKSNEIATRYAMAGIERLKPLAGDIPRMTIELRKLQEESAVLYQDELVGFQAFAVTCAAQQVAPMNTRLTSLKPEELTTVRRAGAMQMRTGVFQMIAGGLMSEADTRLKLENRLKMLTALADNIDSLASVLPENMRSILAQSGLAGAKTVDPALKSANDKIVEGVVKHRECVGICAL